MASPPRLRPASRARKAATGAGLGVLAALLAFGLGALGPLRDLEGRLTDLRTRLLADPGRADSRLLIVQVEDADLDWAQRELSLAWPWDLEANAAIVELVADAGAAALVVDVLHLDRGAGPGDLPAAAADLSDAERQRRELEALIAQSYGAALARLPSAVGLLLTDTPAYDVGVRRTLAEGRRAIEAATAPRRLVRAGADYPVLGVLEGARRVGFVNALPDPDGIVRRMAVVGWRAEVPYPSLAAAAAGLVKDAPVRIDDDAIHLGDARQALMEDGTFLLNFRAAGRGAYERLSAARLLQWAYARAQGAGVPPEARAALSGRIVVWGVNVKGAEDVIPTPVAESQDGPEVQATALDNLLRGDGRVRAPAGVERLLLVMLLAALGAGARGTRRRGYVHALPLAGLVGVAAAATWAFEAGVAWTLTAPAAGLFLLWGFLLAAQLLTEGRRNRWLEGTFGLYLNPAVIERLKQDPSLLALGGREREVTILFSDIEGFTGQSERLSPERLVALLNEYLTQHADAVLAEGGVLDKFIGDAVMAFYGEPIPRADHALAACRTALAVRDRLPGLERLWRAAGLGPLRVRFGLNTGRVVVGNMGSRQRFSYTAMGDAVNLASRLEGANRFFGTTILVGERTREALGDAVLTRPIARLRVKGKTEPVGVFEALALADGAPEPLRALCAAYGRAHAALRADDLEAARAALEEAQAQHPGDGPTRWLVDLLEGLAQGRRERPWDGTFTLDAK